MLQRQVGGRGGISACDIWGLLSSDWDRRTVRFERLALKVVI